MNYDSETERCTDCDGHSKCYCPPEEEMYDDDNEYYGRDGYEECREQYESIMICDHCSEPTDVCSCHMCYHCGENDLKTIIVQIKCPVAKCCDEGDKVCISCKNVHDKQHDL